MQNSLTFPAYLFLLAIQAPLEAKQLYFLCIFPHFGRSISYKGSSIGKTACIPLGMTFAKQLDFSYIFLLSGFAISYTGSFRGETVLLFMHIS